MAAGHAFVGLMLLMSMLHSTASQISSNIDVDVDHRLFDNLSGLHIINECVRPSYYSRNLPGSNCRHIGLTTEVPSWCKVDYKNAWRKKYLPRKILYYSNSVAVHSILLLAAGDVERNPGDKPKC